MAVQNHDVGCGLGTVKLTIQVGDPQGLQFEELDVIAGTRSTYTAVPRATLERLGVPVERKVERLGVPVPPFRDRRRPHNPRRRRTDHHQAARAGVPHPGHIRRTRRAQLLGTVTLEEAALTLDPVAERLIGPSALPTTPCFTPSALSTLTPGTASRRTQPPPKLGPIPTGRCATVPQLKGSANTYSA